MPFRKAKVAGRRWWRQARSRSADTYPMPQALTRRRDPGSGQWAIAARGAARLRGRLPGRGNSWGARLPDQRVSLATQQSSARTVTGGSFENRTRLCPRGGDGGALGVAEGACRSSCASRRRIGSREDGPCDESVGLAHGLKELGVDLGIS